MNMLVPTLAAARGCADFLEGGGGEGHILPPLPFPTISSIMHYINLRFIYLLTYFTHLRSQNCSLLCHFQKSWNKATYLGPQRPDTQNVSFIASLDNCCLWQKHGHV